MVPHTVVKSDAALSCVQTTAVDVVGGFIGFF